MAMMVLESLQSLQRLRPLNPKSPQTLKPVNTQTTPQPKSEAFGGFLLLLARPGARCGVRRLRYRRLPLLGYSQRFGFKAQEATSLCP